MMSSSIFQLLVSSFLVCSFFMQVQPSYAIGKFLLQSYVVYLGAHSHGPYPSSADLDSATSSHYSLLGSVLGSYEKARDAIFYSYNRHINGFAAVMEEEEAEELARFPNVVSVSLNKMHQLHTTRSWEFLGLERNGIVLKDSIWEKARYGEDTIIGNIDTGVWPESQSFNDQGYGPIPSKWRGNGICEIDNFNSSNKKYCNRKLIGARMFYKGYEAYVKLNASFHTARDTNGHGSHTLSTAGGNFVPGVSVFGNGNGTAKGGSPKARVAAYKVCWPWKFLHPAGCSDADILAAFEAAISDGVDVLSVSIGGSPQNLFYDSTAIGSFHAVANGVVVVSSGGNNGPSNGTVSNVAPWLFTVAASTIDRDFTSYVVLGDKKHLKGWSLSPKGLPSHKFYPLISAEDAKHAHALRNDAKRCRNGTLDAEKVKGKIVVCHEDEYYGTVHAGLEASSVGAVGMILASADKNYDDFLAYPHVLPASQVNYTDGVYVYSYIKREKNPVAYLTKALTETPIVPSPVIASFSSRGPNTIQPSILKPDITAPGVNIIAAYSEGTSVSGFKSDNRRVPYNSMSGTSMSCPHVAGIVGLLKTLHPEWSPAAIKSAIMTTASTLDNRRRPIGDRFRKEATPFAYGSGHIQPDLAIDPGLIYDLNMTDYLNLLCTYSKSLEQIEAIHNKPFICPKSYNVVNFNYPTITVLDIRKHAVNVSRTVTNVGPPSTYNVHVKAPDGVSVVVEPCSLTFKEVGEKKSFKVIMEAIDVNKNSTMNYVFGELCWSNGKHRVKSTIVVKIK